MLIINQVGAQRLARRWPEIKERFDKDVAAFLLTVLDKRGRPWMFRKHEIYQSGGEMAWRGWCKLLAVELADHFRIDNYYVVDGAIYTLDFEIIAMDAFGYHITPTADGGYWLRRGCWQLNYYRRAGMAKRAALKAIRQEIENERNNNHG